MENRENRSGTELTQVKYLDGAVDTWYDYDVNELKECQCLLFPPSSVAPTILEEFGIDYDISLVKFLFEM